MDPLRFHKQAYPYSASSKSIITPHPYSYAMEQLKLGDGFCLSHRWFEAARSYIEAATTLEKMPLANRPAYKHCLRKLAFVHLVQFQLLDALRFFLLSKQNHEFDPLFSEKEVLMERIKDARKMSSGRDDDYRPGLYTGHL